MARKKKRKQTKKQNSRKSKLRKSKSSYGYLIFQLFVITLLCGIVYIVWLDHRVRSEFEGKRWSLPARVYARPLELYIGARMGKGDLLDALNSLGYQNVATLTGPGQYRKQENSIQFINRVFEFWDRQESSKNIRINFSGCRIQIIIDDTST